VYVENFAIYVGGGTWILKKDKTRFQHCAAFSDVHQASEWCLMSLEAIIHIFL